MVSADQRRGHGQGGDWQSWLDGHVNRELGVGRAVGARATPPSLANMEQLLAGLGRPQRRFRCVLVAGTNGKTTTTRVGAALLGAGGYRVGRYTSPHLRTLNERAAVQGEAIGDGVLGRLLEPIAGIEARLSEPLSWFEIVTAAAFAWFAEEQVDVAVIETGLGGAWDATAACEPQVVAVTNIALDHTDYFGTTTRAVAEAEAAIAAPGVGVVLGETDPELQEAFRRRRPGTLWRRDHDFAVVGREPLSDGQRLSLTTPRALYPEVSVPLVGAAHASNVSLGVALAEYVLGRPLDDATVRTALGAVRSPGRMELVGNTPPVLLDGAHNPAGAHTLAGVLAETFPGRRRIWVLGMSRDKACADIVSRLGIRGGDRILCCAATHPRALPAEEVAALVGTLTPTAQVTVGSTVAQSLAAALAASAPDDVVVVTGSLYVVAHARHACGLDAR